MREPCPTSQGSALLNLDQVAQALSVSVVTVRRLIARRALAIHRIGGQVRVSPRDLDAYLNRTRQNAVGEKAQ